VGHDEELGTGRKGASLEQTLELFGTPVGDIRSTLHCLFVGSHIYFSVSAFRCSLTLLYFSLRVNDGWEWLQFSIKTGNLIAPM